MRAVELGENADHSIGVSEHTPHVLHGSGGEVLDVAVLLAVPILLLKSIGVLLAGWGHVLRGSLGPIVHDDKWQVGSLIW